MHGYFYLKDSLVVFITEFEGVEMVSKVVFNKRQVRTTGLSSDDFAGPTVCLLLADLCRYIQYSSIFVFDTLLIYFCMKRSMDQLMFD